MWASNDQDTRWTGTAPNFKLAPIDHLGIAAKARQMQAQELTRLFRAIGRGIKAVFGILAKPYKVWSEYQNTYHELSMLDDRMLADIGISRSDIPRVAAGMWLPQSHMERIIKVGLTPKTEANVNRPQVAA